MLIFRNDDNLPRLHVMSSIISSLRDSDSLHLLHSAMISLNLSLKIHFMTSVGGDWVDTSTFEFLAECVAVIFIVEDESVDAK